MIRAVAPTDRARGAAAELAERFGTPLYVFDGARMEREARAFQAVAGPDVTVAYSMKSNPLMGVVARLHRAGCGAEVASGHEYRIARRAGVPGVADRLQRARSRPPTTCAAPSREGATVVADGVEQVREIAAPRATSPRPAPASACAWSRPTASGATASGCRRAWPRPPPRCSRAPGLPLTGLHIHLGAYQLGPLPPSGPPIHGVTVEYPVPVARFAAAGALLREVADARRRHRVARPRRRLAGRGGAARATSTPSARPSAPATRR